MLARLGWMEAGIDDTRLHRSRPRPDATPAYHYADVPNRVVAYVVDAAILAVLSFLAAVAVSLAFGPTIRFPDASAAGDDVVTFNATLATANALVSAVIGLVYFAASWVAMRGSPGQRLLGMTIGAEADGARLTGGQAIIRWLLLSGPFVLVSVLTAGLRGVRAAYLAIPLAWYLVLLVTTARDARRQGLHDRLSGTVVVKPLPPAAWSDDHDR